LQIQPIKTSNRIRETYLRYLKTLFSFQDEELRRQFEAALQSPELLIKGPILEATPRFRQGASIRNLVDENILESEFKRLCTEYLPYERPLYLHQEQAIRKAQNGRNIIVATGTGSGKTECFLIPIFNHLLQEKRLGKLHRPGVRALLLYPMNALANDQLKRLRRLLGSYPEITFGRYTGDTPWKPKDALERFQRNYPDEPLIPNELHSRTEMQAHPPHILLTNYAMLEYLLLRPEDAPFFDGDSGKYWKFIVLDEAHVYDGAQATEIAMLLRRLKDRIVQSETGKLQIIATSATLGGGVDDFPSVASFASDLFAEPFKWNDSNSEQQDIVEASRDPLIDSTDSWGSLSASTVRKLKKALIDQDHLGMDLHAIATELEVDGVPPSVLSKVKAILAEGLPDSQARALYELLRGEGNVLRVQQALDKNPVHLREIAEEIFPQDNDPNGALVALISLGVRARKSASDLPLLPARYHLFARALEGAFLCLNEGGHPPSESGEIPPRIFLRRYETCPHCGYAVFEIASCSRCGLTYLVGQVKEGHQLFDRRDGINPKLNYFVHETASSDEYISTDTEFLVFDPEIIEQDDEDEYVSGGESLDKIDECYIERHLLCKACGAIAASDSSDVGCDCGKENTIPIYRVEQGRRKTHRCVSCGALGGGGLIHRFLTGQDAPVSVLVMELYQELPPSTDPWLQSLPGQGRKMLIFSDSRQNAAFFAPYLERSYNRSMRRSMIFKALSHRPDEERTDLLRIDDLIGRLAQQGDELDLFTQDQSREERRRIIGTWLSLEIGAIDRRISLEGVALVAFHLIRPKHWAPPPPLLQPPWDLTEDEAWSVIVTLLDTLRRQRVMTYPDGVDPAQEPEFAPRQRAYFMRENDPDPKRGVFAWMPKRGSNSRLDYLTRLLKSRTDLDEHEVDRLAREALAGIWRHLTDPGTQIWRDHLVQEHLRGAGVVFRLNHRMYELEPTIDPDSRWHICDRCGNVSPNCVSGVCPTYRCKGHLEPLSESNRHRWDNLYRHIYQELAPIPLKAQEHTAQWSSQAAAEIQDAFVRGELNVLSCSTTFELGVDVGDLQAVLLRNMPPRTSNYVQRAGRAGRRLDSAAFSLTFAQRRSHDLTFYSQPLQMVSGQIRPPSISIRNAKIIRRHLHSVVFSAFFREEYQGGTGVDYRNVGDFFFERDGKLGTRQLAHFLARKDASLQAALERIIPAELHAVFGLKDWKWVKELTGDGSGVLDMASEELHRDIGELQRLKLEMAEKDSYIQAERYKKIIRNLLSRHLFGYLGTRNVLPKYGFPVDVVELKTNHLAHIPEALKVELDRDLSMAISEFAPGGQVVAAKRVWQSGGIRTLPGRDLEEYDYVICPQCRRFHHGLSDSVQFGLCSCGENLDAARERGTFVIPVYGFIAARQATAPGESRPQKIYSSRIYFADYEKDIHGESGEPEFALVEELSSNAIQVKKGYSRYGILTAVNAGFGRHFRICTRCGFSEPLKFPVKSSNSHKNPLTGKECQGYWVTRDIGHRFITDVLQVRISGHLLDASVTPRKKPMLMRSLLYALLEGASETLGIRRDDIDGTLHPLGLIFFDSVPGGAGHVERIQAHLPQVFRAAHRRVAKCECGPETSCYECLRNYQNQYVHDELQRGIVVDFLGRLFESVGMLEGV